MKPRRDARGPLRTSRVFALCCAGGGAGKASPEKPRKRADGGASSGEERREEVSEQIEIEPGKTTELTSGINLYALSLVAIRKEGGDAHIEHAASATDAATDGEAQKAGFEEARERWPEDRGWESHVQAGRINLASGVRTHSAAGQ